MYKLVLIRHGQSEWNLQNRFTGWVDVDLTAKGVEQAKQAGNKLAGAGFDFDIAYTSVLTRAIHTLWHTLDAMDRAWLPVVKTWRLNERHYGGLQGLDKAETAQKYGDEQVLLWRRSYAIKPPLLGEQAAKAERADSRYRQDPSVVPLAECLKDTIARVLPCWQNAIAPNILQGQKVLLSAHGNSIRALVKHLENIDDAEILKVNIPNGQPLVYELDAQLQVLNKYYL